MSAASASNRALAGLLLRRFTLRHWRSAPGQSALLVVILALGIAVFFSVRLANRAAVTSFQNFTDLITRQSDWIITAPAGLLPEAILPELRERLGDQPVTVIPVLDTTASPPRRADFEEIGSRPTFQILGLDLVAIQNLASARSPDRSWFGQASGVDSFWKLLRSPRAVFINAALAVSEGLGVGSKLPLVINERVVELDVAGIIPQPPGDPAAPATLLIMDFAALQPLAGKLGRLDRIEFIVEPGPDDAVRRTQLREQLAAWGEGRWFVSSPADRRDNAALMTRAFRMNLTILSLIALLVGVYLIFQALDGAVVRRREEIAILRSLGVEERAIRRAWLVEAALVGIVGGLLGALLGWAGAQFSVRFVGRTVNALYYATSVQSAHLDRAELAAALALAVAGSLVAGWVPAREAARTPPAQVLVRHATAAPGRRVFRNGWLGLALLAVGTLLATLPPWRFPGGRLPLAGYAAALCWIFGGGIVAAILLRPSARLWQPLGARWVSVKLAASQLVNPSGRHRLAVAGLLCAVAMTAGMATLVASFEATMQGWIERTFQADLYISSYGAQSASTQNRIAPATWRAVTNHPGVAGFNGVQACEILLNGQRTILASGNLDFLRRHTRMAWRQPPLNDDVFDPERNAALALVSEAFTERFQLRRGDVVTVPTPAGPQRLTIAGVFSDYGNERGTLVVERRRWTEWFGDEYLSSVILVLKAGFAPETVRAELLGRHSGLNIFTNGHIRGEVLRVFRQTFAITYALEIIGVIVAVLGLALTLVSVLLDRRNELTTLRALGLDRHEMARATAWEGSLVALCGVGGGLVVSVALGWLLIFVINQQTFGWTLSFQLPWAQLGLLAALVVGAAAGVSYAVGWWGAALPADREE